ncbi:MAG: helix-turn-helix domain-containing protein [Actinobacteria bacterium]|nr:helix-turn-helix domain-containing protein [Actinomycetota bacterium]
MNASPVPPATLGHPGSSADLLLHPVRLRIVQAFLGDRALTTAELQLEPADVATTSLYRHVGRLADAGVLEVVGERQGRGSAERTYRLVPGAASVGVDELASMNTEEHRRAFTVFVAGLLGDFDRLLERGRPDFVRDGIGYRQTALHLTDAEMDELVDDLRAVVAARAALPAAKGRRRRLLATVVMPAT